MTDGCVHLLFNSSWKFHQLAAGQLQGNRYGKEKVGDTARPPRTKSHLPGHSPPASKAGRRVGPALYSLRPHCVRICPLAGVYTTTLFVMLDIVKVGGRAPPHPHQAGLIFPS